MRVSEIMSSPVCWVDPEATLAEATTLMGERSVGSALVMENDRLVGILTERDVVRALSNAHDAPVRPVAEWMSLNPRTAPSDADVRDALHTMLEGGFRHLPIVEGDSVVGMVSMRDVARVIA